MLVLSRRSHEAVVIGGSSGFDRVVRITVIDVRDGTVKLGIEADVDTPVYRSEVPLRIFPDTPRGPAAAKKTGPRRPATDSGLLRRQSDTQANVS
jgi:carbon storage regulator CsrA